MSVLRAAQYVSDLVRLLQVEDTVRFLILLSKVAADAVGKYAFIQLMARMLLKHH